jgi:Neuraminidase (sialidase)
MRSSDNGSTWTKPERSEPIHDLQRGGATISSFGKLTELPDGTALMSVYCEFWDGRGNRSFLARSKDGGKTWGDLSQIGEASNETAILALPDGSVVAALRSEKTGHLSTSVSKDGGRTWTMPVLLTKDLEHPADLIRLRDNSVLLTYGVRNAPFGIAAMLSHDGGLNWDVKRKMLLADDTGNIDSGYPSSVQLPDGRIVTMYYQVDDPADTPASAKSKVVVWQFAK